jgi:putative transposase
MATMPRQLRGEYPGAIYHVMSPGNGQQATFRGDLDRQDFIKTLAETCEETGFQVQAYWKSASAKLHRWKKANEPANK